MIAADFATTPEGLLISSPNSMTTVGGLRVNPLKMTEDDIEITDIAHALSRQCRYNGHTSGFLSVARHCVWVSQRLQDRGYGRKTVLTGLLHDAAEAYLGDMIRPLKHGRLGKPYMKVEEAVEAVIAEVFGLYYPLPERVKAADRFVLMQIEMPRPHGARFTWESDPETDKAAFLHAFDRLMKGAK